jgi:hypothetical protein
MTVDEALNRAHALHANDTRHIARALMLAFADGLERGKVYNYTAYWLQKVDLEISGIRAAATELERP